jgi:subtilisin-like proprotein convertase family protein
MFRFSLGEKKMTMTSRRVLSTSLCALFLVVASGAAFSQPTSHKVVAKPGVLDEKSPNVQLIADYGSYRLYRVTDDALSALPKTRREGVEVRDDMDLIRLDAYAIDARSPVVKIPPSLTAAPSTGTALHLVQFVGPIKQEWLDDLTRRGIRPVQYIESNAYLVFADAAGRRALDELAVQGSVVQYSGAYHPYYKLGPTLRVPVSQPVSDNRLVPVTIQILSHDGSAATEKQIEAVAASIDSDWEQVLGYRNIHATLPLARVAEIASLPDVTWVAERLPITMNDEKQGQIVAGHFNGSFTGPSAPGYKAFLDGKGFPTDPNAYPIVGLSDDGVGNGSTTNGAGDPTFTKLGDGTTSRIAFVKNCTSNPLGNGVDGHGHINTSIVGGYDVRTGDPYQDVDGYQRGMGMNPYGRMAMTKIFANGGSYDIGGCGGTDAGVITNSYGLGARISSNSWGCSGCAGSYDTSSQAYDAGTRDADPVAAGNQEYLFIFAAGNSGPSTATVGTPGNGKNMVTAAASENQRSDWTDGCAVGPTGADNAMDIIDFSSRGPSPGGRVKPEITAPGTHIQGTASVDPAYDGSGVCDQYQPTTQTIFAASSGTSHSTPSIAGTASLYYRWLQDHYLNAVPSPALTKAYLLTHTTYLTGVSANDTLPSNVQGYGMPNLEMAFDSTPRYLVDQSVRFDNSGDTWVFHGSVADASKPVRIVMVYTDAAGAVGTSPQVNNLNLQAVVGSSTYNGNVFSGQYSVTGGSPDNANNYEAVFLPAGTTGAITINVNAFNIAGDGVPNVGDATDQDFALVCYNCATCAGTISTDHPSYNCGSAINITLGDSDLTGLGTQVVTVRSTTEPTPENVTLNESPANSGVFVGTFPTSSGAPVHGDGAISVANGDLVTLSYLDVSACGNPNVTVEQTAAIDCQAPIISNVHTSNVTGNSAILLWDTNEPANSSVTYGAAPPPPGTTPPTLPALTTSHAYSLTGLSACTPYVFSVASTDAANNSASADNGGAYYTFATGVNVQPTYPYLGAPVAIPDNLPSGASATISVPDAKPIVDLNVTINSLTHTFDGDLVIHLIGPDATDVVLSLNRGSSGDNFTNTVFDDSAATAISAGAAPFTGSFKPDSPLAAFNGKIAAGTWTLFVVDTAAIDTGFINSFSLNFTYPAQACGAHASYNSNASVADTCSTGGAGGNGVWEPGEQVQFKVNLAADGTTGLTGVSASVVATTPGVTMVNGAGTYPNIAAGASADSNAPHFTATLPAGLACGSSVAFQVTINANEGSWVGSFTHDVGQVISGNGTALNETFSAGIPATWTVVDGGSGGGAAATWTTANPGGRSILAPLTAPVVIIDSDNAGSGAGITQDEQLITPVMNLSTATTVALDFDQYYRHYSAGLVELADVDVRSSATAGAWVNVLQQSQTDSPNPDHKTLNITAQAAGAPDVQVRFHYYNAHYEYYWQVDNIKVTYTAPGGCNQTVCPAASTFVKPVPDGSFGTAMKASRVDPAGTSINVTWDVSTCASTNYHVLYGDLATVSSYAIGGSACAIGTSGTYGWSGVPAGSLWYVVVADSGTTTEGSWGTGVGGAERGGGSASGQCSMASRDNSGTCP